MKIAMVILNNKSKASRHHTAQPQNIPQKYNYQNSKGLAENQTQAQETEWRL